MNLPPTKTLKVVDPKAVAELEAAESFVDRALREERPTVGSLLDGELLAVDHRALDARARLSASTVAEGVKRASGGVGIIQICGPLVQRGYRSWFGSVPGYDQIVAAFAALANDASIDAILLQIDSPGGEVAGCFEAVRRMRGIRDAAGKPVVAFADELIASAAYAIASVADAGILAPSRGEVGSIGCVAVHATFSRMYVDAGVDVSVFRSGKRKAEGLSCEPLTEEARQAFQASVDAVGQDFAAMVAAARGLDASRVLGLEGAILSAAEAVKAGIADRVGSLEDAVKAAMGAAKQRQKERNMAIENDQLTRICSALGVDSAEEAIGAIEGLKATGKQAEADKATYEAERARYAEIESANKLTRAEALVREGREAGKISASDEKYWLEDATANYERTKARLATSPVIVHREAASPPLMGAKASGSGGNQGGSAAPVWEEIPTEEKNRMQREEPERFAALHSEYRARVGRRR